MPAESAASPGGLGVSGTPAAIAGPAGDRPAPLSKKDFQTDQEVRW